jgi:hypothetical protein
VSTNKVTFYFRHRFVVPPGVTNPPLRLRHVIDDGAVFYLNTAAEPARFFRLQEFRE